ncbi:DUF1844 domain-containing protein, partial [bacterium]|nr:DUF1844 domain-containing protein [bacterium]
MTDEAQEKGRASFAGIVLLLRQLATQLMEQGNAAQARGIVDGLEAIEARTAGNLDEGEAQFVRDILFELRMAFVRGVSGGGEAGDDDPGAGEASG